ncbi:MAG: leucyl/phenylalanyl-tRNA--protein transferase [Tepidiformaceae bacterium]
MEAPGTANPTAALSFGFGERLAASARHPRALPACRYRFPAIPGTAGDLIAEGADFQPETVVAAYRAGCFPWPHPPRERLWFSPNPRAVIFPGGLRVSRRLARTVRQGRFTVSIDTAFAEVMAGCARRDDTWITPALVAGYASLHDAGWAHSIEAWSADGALAGGLYGVRGGRLFGAESMFHAVADASKVAMVAMMEWAAAAEIGLVDVQVLNAHTASMGAIEVPRAEYLRLAARAMEGR